ncbi:MAG: hypothetical protein AB8G22_15535 [Saprospiraceae bacterium]
MNKDLKIIFGDHHGLDQKSVSFLAKALERANLPGFDYIEFKQSLHALQAMDMPEETCFKSAFATAATVGLTKDKLLKTADHYKSILTQEKVQFEAAMRKQIDQRVSGKMSEVEKLKKQVEDYRKKITELERKIARSQDTIDNADAHIQAAKEHIVGTKESFETTHQSVMNQIEVDIDNIQRYL